MEVLKTISSIITPIIVFILGLMILKKTERTKLDVLKEKEWQVKWAELFLSQAIEFNENISKIVCGLDQLNWENDNKKRITQNAEIRQLWFVIRKIEWNIKNFTQFAPNFGKDVENTQIEAIGKIKELIDTKRGDLELIRKIQFRYNEAVKNTHSEMLNVK